MSVLAVMATAAEEGPEHVAQLFMPNVMFGVVVFVIFTVLAIVTFSFRDVANRHAEKAAAYAREHGESGVHH